MESRVDQTAESPSANPLVIVTINFSKNTEDITPTIALTVRQKKVKNNSFELFLKSILRSLFNVPFFGFGRVCAPLTGDLGVIALLIVVTYLVLRMEKFLINGIVL